MAQPTNALPNGYHNQPNGVAHNQPNRTLHSQPNRVSHSQQNGGGRGQQNGIEESAEQSQYTRVDTISSPPLEETERVLQLIAEASKQENAVWPLTNEDTEESRAHNDRMTMLWSLRSDSDSPGICICNVSEPAVALSGFFAHMHPCRQHAVRWFHFFHCTRAPNEAFPVMMQQLGWCECEACLHYSRLFDDHANGVVSFGLGQAPFGRRGMAGAPRTTRQVLEQLSLRRWRD